LLALPDAVPENQGVASSILAWATT
jgi:hypothetical protein